MGETTGISWTDSTINCWHGCTKVDTLCKYCYAEVSTPIRVKRAGGLEVWGPKAARSETKWWRADLRRWNRAQTDAMGVWRAGMAYRETMPPPHRVFGQSLSDTFEDAHGGRVINRHGADTGDSLDWLRAEFFAAIEAAPALTFQLLTKRPENVCRMVPASWLEKWPVNVWIGTSVGDQESADLRVPHLLKIHAAVRFLSVEPQVGQVDLTRICPSPHVQFDALRGYCGATPAEDTPAVTGIQWVIQGGESGSKARPFDLAWARSLMWQCRDAGVPYFLKQLGARPVEYDFEVGGPAHPVRLADSHGGDEAEWPEDLRGCRAFPVTP